MSSYIDRSALQILIFVLGHKRRRRAAAEDSEDDSFFNSWDSLDFGDFGEDFESTKTAAPIKKSSKDKSQKLVNGDTVPDSEFSAYDDYYFDVDKSTVSISVNGKLLPYLKKKQCTKYLELFSIFGQNR